MIYNTLIESLRGAGKSVENWRSSDGSRVLLLPYGGRILGLFAPGDEENFFWTTDALRSADSAKAFYAGSQWHNSGGDRTWLAPEIDFFFPNFPKLDVYFQQRSLDPGEYTLSNDDGILKLTNRSALTVSRTRQQIEVEITKAISPALNPLRREPNQWTNVRFAGFTLHATLRIVSKELPPHIGMWHLTQLPHGGEMLIPTFFRSEPKIYMGTISADDLTVSDRMVRYKMRARGENKLGIRAAAITGRVGYVSRHHGEASLVVRNFFVDPSAEYVDVPWAETDNFGYAFQACSIDNDQLHLGQFSEMEYHMPAIGAINGQTFTEDRSQLWAFRGPESEIKSVARHLLSADI